MWCICQSYIKGVLWCDFKFSFLFGVIQAVHALIRSIKLQRLKIKAIFFIKVKTRPRPPKTAHLNTHPHVYLTMWEDLQTPHKCIHKERRRNYYSRCSIVAMSWRCCVFPNMVRGVTFPSHAWGIQPITTHWIAGQLEHIALFRTMSFVKIDAFQKGSAERSNNNLRYVENVFLNLK